MDETKIIVDDNTRVTLEAIAEGVSGLEESLGELVASTHRIETILDGIASNAETIEDATAASAYFSQNILMRFIRAVRMEYQQTHK